MKLFNSLTRQVEEFDPLNPPKVGMYTCGPTVYDYASIGNFRTYTTADILYRSLQVNGYQVDYIINFTDVGHLTGDNLGDSSTGEDRMEKASRREGRNAWEIAQFYIDVFLDDFHKLNLKDPKKFVRATDHIKEQIDLVKELKNKGFTYKTSDGIYFNTKAYEEQTGKKYGELSTLDEIREGARVEVNPEKKNPRDFALWKFSPKGEKRQMEWDSPWGIGFPGWHIECSAMSMKYLGETLDVHAGGEDLRSTHHPNEIAQSEAATGKQFVRFWIHGAFLQVDGGRMGKSLGNFYTIKDIESKGYDPLSLRYLYLTGHYNDKLNFTWESLTAAQNALNNLRELVRDFDQPGEISKDYWSKFLEAINNDLNTPQGIAAAGLFLTSCQAAPEAGSSININQPNPSSRAANTIEAPTFKITKLSKDVLWIQGNSIRDENVRAGLKYINDRCKIISLVDTGNIKVLYGGDNATTITVVVDDGKCIPEIEPW